jgi:hypothetical protein
VTSELRNIPPTLMKGLLGSVYYRMRPAGASIKIGILEGKEVEEVPFSDPTIKP